MNPTETNAARPGGPAQAVVNPAAPLGRAEKLPGGAAPGLELGPRHSGYGLPCAKCRTYYAADLAACPVCQSAERVSPTVAVIPAAEISAEAPVDAAALEAERERFLREFKSQLSGQAMQINASESYCCNRIQSHAGGMEPAAVCQSCYDQLRARIDLLEAALHMDMKAAAQLVYDAVWADPSDPTKTYQNAAQALLGELHRRAGISAVLGPLQPRTH
ncbi:MAG TPA: hypothetical protein VLV49_00395 [Terriglobales bacterium]|nr:hypothetical protein [Terriglobales bacterium]